MAQPTDGLKPGDRVIWHKTARGGYGYTFQIPATLIRIKGERATIKVDRERMVTRVDYTRLRSVRVDNLRKESLSLAKGGGE